MRSSMACFGGRPVRRCGVGGAVFGWLGGGLVGAFVVAGPALAQGKGCEQLRNEIAARIALPKDSFRLDIVPKDSTNAGKTMGSCEMGQRKVVFSDATAPAPAPADTTLPPPAELVRQPSAAPATAAPAPADTSPAVATAATPSRPVVRRGALDEATLSRYKAWIAEARALHPYADSEDRMLKVMLCESGGRAGVVSPNGRHHGLFQYDPQTWRDRWNTYREAPLSDARAQIFATALAWSQGKTGAWGCYKRPH